MCISKHHILMVRCMYLKNKLCLFSVPHPVDGWTAVSAKLNLCSSTVIIYSCFTAGKLLFFYRSHHVMFNNTMSNIFHWNTTDTHSLLKYKRQHVLVPIEPSSGLFGSLGLRTSSGIPICLQYRDSQVWKQLTNVSDVTNCFHTRLSWSCKHIGIPWCAHTLNVRSPGESNRSEDGSIGTETHCLLYFNKLHVSVVFWQNILLIGKLLFCIQVLFFL
jgi:hypothetical protein